MVAIRGETSQRKRTPKAGSKGRAGHNPFRHLLLHGGGQLGTAEEDGAALLGPPPPVHSPCHYKV